MTLNRLLALSHFEPILASSLELDIFLFFEHGACDGVVSDE